MKARTILSQAEDQKTGERIFLSMDAELHRLLQRRGQRRSYQAKDGATAISPYVFHRNGEAIGDIRKTWAAACERAGLMASKRDRQGNVVTQVVDGKEDVVMVPSKMFHDFRRTAARDIHDATKDKELAKFITGHKTDAMFDRYNIIIPEQKAVAMSARMKMISVGKGGRQNAKRA
jgi:integrase